MTLHSANRRQRKLGGNLLMMAVALMLILVTLVAALHHYEVVSRRAAGEAEAELAVLQSRKWALGVALGKASSSEAPSLPVTLGTTFTNATVMTAANAGKEIFSRDGSGDWDGLPDYTIKRTDRVDPPLPPNFTEMTLTPKTLSSSLATFGKYRQLTSDQLPLAAYAPNGNITLEACTGWANPEFGAGDKDTRKEFSGVPAIVAAGGNIAVTEDFPIGVAYSANKNDEDNPIALNTTSLASGVVGPLPFGRQISIDGTLVGQLDAAAVTLTNTAQKLDDKTQQISGAPPSMTEIIEFFFSDCWSGNSSRIKNRLLNWLSVRCATEFPFVSIPGFATTAFPMCYVAFQFWFHGPHPPDSVGYSSTGAANNLVDQLYEKKAEYIKARGRIEYLLAQLNGGQSTSTAVNYPGAGQQVYKPRGNPNCANLANHPSEPPYTCANCTLGDDVVVEGTTTNTPPVPASVSVGLLDRFKDNTQLLRDISDDVNTLQAAKDNKQMALITNLKTKQDMLIWLADVEGYLYDDSGNKAQLGVSGYAFTGVNGFGAISDVAYDVRQGGTDARLQDSIYGADAHHTFNRTLDQVRETFPHQKNWKGEDMGVRDTSPGIVPTRKFATGDVTMQSGDAITLDMWKAITVKKDSKAGDVSDQLVFMKYLLYTTRNKADYPNTIYSKLIRLRNDLNSQLTKVNEGIASIDTAIGTLRGPVETLAQQLSKLPMSRKEEAEKEPFKSDTEFQNNKGMWGHSYLRFGFSFDVMYNIIAWLASSKANMNDLWTTKVPLVWWGNEDNKSPLNLANSLDLKSGLVVPAGRTFYYDNNSVTITGDLWVQRGATIVVKGDLNVLNNLAWLQDILGAAGASGTNPAIDSLRYISMIPGGGRSSGRAILEEGASIVVRNGNLRIDGTLAITGAMNKQRPITCAVLVPEGTANLRGGTGGALTLSDALTWKELGATGKTINKNIVHPYLYAFAPNAAKVYGFGPFKRRKCFFAKWATQYQLEIFIGPFGIPIPVMHPWPIPRDNVQVSIYKGLGYFYAVLANVMMGENLQTSTFYMPFTLILPKVDFTAIGISGPDLNALVNRLQNISMPTFDGQMIKAALEKINPANGEMWEALVNKLLADVVKSVMISMIPAPWNMAVSAALGAILPPQSSDSASGPMAAPLGGFSSPMTALANSIPGYDTLNAVKDKVFTGMMRDVHGAVVFANRITVGYDQTGTRMSTPLAASGLFVARNNIDINADYLVGSAVSATGSINASSSKLMFVPAFTRASLQIPDDAPRITESMPSAMPQFLRRALDVEYGPYQDRDQRGLDVGYSRKWTFAEGWER